MRPDEQRRGKFTEDCGNLMRVTQAQGFFCKEIDRRRCQSVNFCAVAAKNAVTSDACIFARADRN
jgi:hypothetical protein